MAAVKPQDAEQRILVLENQLARERQGRKKAEDILRTKMMQLYESNQYLSTMTQRLQSALWASNDLAWEYSVDQARYFVYRNINEKSASVSHTGSFDDVVNNIHPDDRFTFAQAWHAHMSYKTVGFNTLLRHFSRKYQSYRWVRLRGKKVVDASGLLSKVIGVYKDVNTEYNREKNFQTVSNAFLQFKHPAFILDSSTEHIVITDSFYEFLDSSKDSLTTSELREIVPISVIVENQKAGNETFSAQIGEKENKRNCWVNLSELMSSKENEGEQRYIVGFFVPQ